MTPAPRLEDAFERVLDHVRANLRPGPGRMFAGGKSMGGRIAANVAAKETGAGEQDLAGLLVFFAVGCVALPRVVHATRAVLKPAPTSHRVLPTTKNPAHLCKPICETQH